MGDENRNVWTSLLDQINRGLSGSGSDGTIDRRSVLRVLGIGAGAAALSACDSAVEAATSGGRGATTAASTTGSGGSTGGRTSGGGSTGTATTGSTGEPVCVLNDNLTRGPFWIDEFDDHNDDPETALDAAIPDRSDVTNDSEGNAGVQPGLPLSLQLTIYAYDSSSNTCTPLSGARVDIWQCNAAGVYSDVGGQVGRDFLRGYQVTGADGKVAFSTIYPGWYPGRVTHIHLKIRVISQLADGGVDVPTEATTQVFFADSITAAVYGVAPYASKGQSPLVNATDSIYASMANPTPNLVVLSGDTTNGYVATASIGVALGTKFSG